MTLPRSKARRFVRGFRPYRRYRLEGGRVVVLNSKGRRLGALRLRLEDLASALVWLCMGTWP